MGQSEPIQRDAPGREALNAAFWELGLRFQWDAQTWEGLAVHACLADQLRAYLGLHQPHLLALYDPDTLAAAALAHAASPTTGRLGIEAFSSAR